MRLAASLALIALCFQAPLPAAMQAAASANPVPTTPAAKRIRADVAFLADDLLEGREAGQRGYELAAKYVTARMIDLGLDPEVGPAYEQRVRFLSRSIRRDDKSFVTIGSERLAHGGDILVSAASEPTTTAQAVFAGYGLEDARFKLADYAGLDVRGKIAVVLAGFPTGLPADVSAHLDNRKAAIAAAHGAIGMIVVDTPTRARVSHGEIAFRRLTTGRWHGSIPTAHRTAMRRASRPARR